MMAFSVETVEMLAGFDTIVSTSRVAVIEGTSRPVP
jgi:hypothetical protein